MGIYLYKTVQIGIAHFCSVCPQRHSWRIKQSLYVKHTEALRAEDVPYQHLGVIMAKINPPCIGKDHIIQCNGFIVLSVTLTNLSPFYFTVQFPISGFTLGHAVRTCLSTLARLARPAGLWRNLFPITLCMKRQLFSWISRELLGGIHELAVSYLQTRLGPLSVSMLLVNTLIAPRVAGWVT